MADLNLAVATHVLEELYPLRYAEEWDEPGLIVGIPHGRFERSTALWIPLVKWFRRLLTGVLIC